MLLSQLMPSEIAMPVQWAGLDVSGLTADSREVQPGFLFAALPGTATDGARFVPQALEHGAVAVLAPEDTGMTVPDTVALVKVRNPRQMLAKCAARFFGAQPEITVAVTGTNGKTSVASFVRQIWQALGHRAASLGTVGLVTPDGTSPLAHTTPDPVALHRMLFELAEGGVQHLAAEVSSHGLAQYRADGVHFAAAAFTNISRDHLDYHSSFEDYFAQKLRLFSELLSPGASAVVNADSPDAGRVVKVCQARGLNILTVGRNGEALTLVRHDHNDLGHSIRVRYNNEDFDVEIPLVGDFQVSNALVAAALVLATGSSALQVFRALESLRGAKGRLDLVGRTATGALVFVDFAHTPDALESVLEALRPFTTGRLVVVFGCGGDRDRGKRPQMGIVAERLADIVYVTDDNPRTEDAAAVRRDILAACKTAIEIGDRADAIATSMKTLRGGDILLIAGKGHESGQIVGTKTLPFSDHDVVRDLLGEGGGSV